MNHLREVCIAALIAVSQIPTQANAELVFDWSNPCFNDCEAIGVLDAPLTIITGTLELDLDPSVAVQAWSAADVSGFRFEFGSFVIDDSNSSLINAGSAPFNTTSDNPFSDEDGFLVALYTPDPFISLVIAQGGLNLVQSGIGDCPPGDCQSQSLGLYSRSSVVPIPPAISLLVGAMAGLLRARRVA